MEMDIDLLWYNILPHSTTPRKLALALRGESGIYTWHGVGDDYGATGCEWASKSQTRFQACIALIEKQPTIEQQGRGNAPREVPGVMVKRCLVLESMYQRVTC
jgi:hypothetical protein